jgi:hypothetical protein
LATYFGHYGHHQAKLSFYVFVTASPDECLIGRDTQGISVKKHNCFCNKSKNAWLDFLD